MSLEALTEDVRGRIGEASGLDATIKFDFGADGVIYIDAASTPNTVTNENKDADCTIGMSIDDFRDIADGDLDAMTAFMMGKLEVRGDMGIAMRLREVL